jgi:hypothetical protein
MGDGKEYTQQLAIGDFRRVVNSTDSACSVLSVVT